MEAGSRPGGGFLRSRLPGGRKTFENVYPCNSVKACVSPSKFLAGLGDIKSAEPQILAGLGDVSQPSRKSWQVSGT
ncbi:hypothetical protein L3X38_021913 [Prunus dulcis]|uniref:Uncharacterized protein n=1 Tax=Prunus dulcis TaxID=3755 RepID=A0AAD4VUZ4_PRUDU|nr:hypothetical protein L3X38_021896 [Prunus dulcis]KAI5331771.1 hypothetical protein L3X38_021897 [Prunus dulcis]KAI5331772.1 hypothetical protein L3X38_021898 [Prunus dulcis]KAI5331773.1 hypothetical protein L3X38_021899 [Prunus dulcis]KAI5331785.1 hypothetical protein L3X38_021911 [Prunus dulcis]